MPNASTAAVAEQERATRAAPVGGSTSAATGHPEHRPASGHNRDVGTTSSLRSSSGMLLGYAAAQLINFVVQIGIVRYLTKSDYGAYAWALAGVLLVQAVVPLGLDRASARFLAMYDERADRPRLLGMIALEVVVVAGMGTIVVAGTYLLSGPLTQFAPSQSAAALLVLMIALAPIQALDILIVEMFAVFSSPWAVFLRRYVLEPLLRLAVVVLLILTAGDATFLTAGFVVVGATGLVLYSILLYRLLRRTGLAAHFSFRTIRLPWREVSSFCGPMLLTGLVAVATTEFAAIVVGSFGGAQQVADFRAVLPIAALNLGVLFSFTTLFAPSASRLYARESHQELRDLYWQNAIWVSVLTFPVLAVTTALAGPFTVFALGDRYASSAAVLAVLSIGYYINASWGFNGFTIQLIGRSRWVLLTNAVTLVVMVPTSMVLANLYGAIGGAVAVLVTLVVHNALKQAGLGFGGGIGIVHGAHTRVLLQVAASLGLLALLDRFLQPSLWVGLGMVVGVWLALLRLTRQSLRLADVFPEIGRIPVLRNVLAGPTPRAAAADQPATPEPAPGAAPLRSWPAVDWRFLIPDVVGHAGYRGPVPADELRVLREAGVRICTEPGPGDALDVLIATHADAGLARSDLAAVRPGGWYLLRLGSVRAGIGSRLRTGRIRRWRRELERRDCDSVTAYWHAPNAQRCSYLVDLADRVAVDAMLRRYHGVRFGRAKSIATRLLNRLGLIGLVARDVTIVGRFLASFAADAEPVGAPLPTRTLAGLLSKRHRAPAKLMITPWFEASRHVVTLYLDPADRRLRAVAKLPRRPWDTSGIRREAQALRLLEAHPEQLAGQHPVVLGLEMDCRPYLLESAMTGEPVDPDLVRGRSAAVIAAGAQLADRLAAIRGGSDAGGSDAGWFDRLLGEPLRAFPHRVPLPAAAELVARTLDLLAPLRDGAALPMILEHGDVSHPNLLMTADSQLTVLDWERYERCGLPGHDLVFFLQYVAEARMSAVARPAQLAAFDAAFVGEAAWARPHLLGYLAKLDVPNQFLPPLILATWARTSTGLLTRLDADETDEAGRSADPSMLADTFASDRDFLLWQHAVRRFEQLAR